MLIMFVNLI